MYYFAHIRVEEMDSTIIILKRLYVTVYSLPHFFTIINSSILNALVVHLTISFQIINGKQISARSASKRKHLNVFFVYKIPETPQRIDYL